jgi:hypothetical protein
VSAAAELVEQARLALDELRQAWAWLQLLAEPGRDGSDATVIDDGRAESLAAQGMQARAYREWNLRNGMTALPPTPASARLGVLDAQAAVHTIVLDLAGQAAAAEQAVYVGQSAGDQAVTDALSWLGYRALEHIRDAELAGTVAAGLQRANTIARQAARVLGEEPTQPLEQRCPACGRQSLQLHYDRGDLVRSADGERPRNRSRWYAECVSQRCRCTVEGCGCGMRTRVAGRRHAWAYGELADLWRAIERAQLLRRRRIDSRAEGRGWGILGA